MRDQLHVSDFTGVLNSNFRVIRDSGEVVDVELIEVEVIGERHRLDSQGKVEPAFSLIFLGPMDRLLSQGIHQFEHPTLGSLAIFIVPIGPTRDRVGLRYQAIFN